LVRFARKKPASMQKNTPATAALANKLHPQTSRIAINSSPVVNIFVADTAIPKAAARWSDLPKNRVRPNVAIISSQLITPT